MTLCKTFAMPLRQSRKNPGLAAAVFTIFITLCEAANPARRPKSIPWWHRAMSEDE